MDEYVCELMDRPLEQPQMMLARRERVVRCRDCAHGYRRSDSIYCSIFLRWGRRDNPEPLPVEPDGFCAWGEPREVTD